MEKWRNEKEWKEGRANSGRMQSPMTFMRLFDSVIASAAPPSSASAYRLRLVILHCEQVTDTDHDLLFILLASCDSDFLRRFYKM